VWYGAIAASAFVPWKDILSADATDVETDMPVALRRGAAISGIFFLGRSDPASVITIMNGNQLNRCGTTKTLECSP
jgi:hypothetical protein